MSDFTMGECRLRIDCLNIARSLESDPKAVMALAQELADWVEQPIRDFCAAAKELGEELQRRGVV